MSTLNPVNTTQPNGFVDKFTHATDIGVANGNQNVLTVYARAAVNAFDPQVGGAAASIIAGAAAGRMRVTGLSGMAAGMVGELLRLSGSANAANNSANNLLTNGQGFWIAAFVNATTVDVINAGAVVPDAGPLVWSYGCAGGSDLVGDGTADAPFLTLQVAENYSGARRLFHNNNYIVIDPTGAGKCVSTFEQICPPSVVAGVGINHPAPPSVMFGTLGGGVTIYAKETVLDTIALADIAAIVNGALTALATIIPITGTTTGYQVPPATTVATDPLTTGNFLEVASTAGFDDAGALYVESAGAGVYEQMDYSHKDATKFYGITRNQRGGVLAAHAAGKAVYQPRCLRIGTEIIDYLVMSATDFGSAAAPCGRGKHGTAAATAASAAPIYQTDFAHLMLTVVTNKTFLALSGSTASLVAGAPAGKMRVTGLSGMTSAMVGSPLDLYGAAAAASNRHFPITDFISATEVYVQLRGDAVVLPDVNNGAISWTAQQHKARLFLGATVGQVGTVESNTANAIGTEFTGAPPTLPFSIATPSAEFNRSTNTGRVQMINVITPTISLNLIGLDVTHDFVGASAQGSFEITFSANISATGCRFDANFNNVRTMFLASTGCVFSRGVRVAGSLPGGNHTRIHYYDATLQHGGALTPFNDSGIVFERCNDVGSGNDIIFPKATGNFQMSNFWIRKGRANGLLLRAPMFLTATNGRIDECVGSAFKAESQGMAILTNVRTSIKSTRYGIETVEGSPSIQVDANCATLTGALSASAADGGGGGDGKVGTGDVYRWWDFFAAARMNSRVTKDEFDIPSVYRQPLKFAFTGLGAADSFDITALAGSPPAIQSLNALRVTAGAAAFVGTYVLTDAAGTLISPAADTVVGVARLSDDGKTITFPVGAAVTAFTLSYLPAARAHTGGRVWAA